VDFPTADFLCTCGKPKPDPLTPKSKAARTSFADRDDITLVFLSQHQEAKGNIYGNNKQSGYRIGFMISKETRSQESRRIMSPSPSRKTLRNGEGRISGDGSRCGLFTAFAHGIQKVQIRLCLAEFINQELHGLDLGELAQDLPQDPDPVEVGFTDEKLFFPRSGTIDVDSREQTAYRPAVCPG